MVKKLWELPAGIGEVNQGGLDYYNSLIDELLDNGITPLVTLYHWDMPQVQGKLDSTHTHTHTHTHCDLTLFLSQALEDAGGWMSDLSPTWFEEYARVCYQEFGDRVKDWITINEPLEVSIGGYGTAGLAPGYTEIGTWVYTVSHNLIRSHAKAYRAYEADFADDQNGKCGVVC